MCLHSTDDELDLHRLLLEYQPWLSYTNYNIVFITSNFSICDKLPHNVLIKESRNLVKEPCYYWILDVKHIERRTNWSEICKWKQLLGWRVETVVESWSERFVSVITVSSAEVVYVVDRAQVLKSQPLHWVPDLMSGKSSLPCQRSRSLSIYISIV